MLDIEAGDRGDQTFGSRQPARLAGPVEKDVSVGVRAGIDEDLWDFGVLDQELVDYLAAVTTLQSSSSPIGDTFTGSTSNSKGSMFAPPSKAATFPETSGGRTAM